MNLFGTQLPKPQYNGRGVIQRPDITDAGNVIIAVGHTFGDGWVKSGHVVLTPAEARELGHRLQECSMRGSAIARPIPGQVDLEGNEAA